MSVIEAALRRAQMQQKKNARPHAAISEAVAEPTVSKVAQRGATASWWRRVFSPAMIILVVLAVATIVVIGQPGWGEGFQRWYSEPVQAPAAPVHSAAPAPAAAIIATTTEPVTTGPIIGPEVDLSDMLAPTEVVNSAPVNARSSAPTNATSAPATMAATPLHSRIAITASAESAMSVMSRFQLGGVMMTGSKRLAIVNGAVVEEGQRVGGAVVTAITRRDVTITVDGKAYRVPLRAHGN